MSTSLGRYAWRMHVGSSAGGESVGHVLGALSYKGVSKYNISFGSLRITLMESSL